MAEIPQAVLHLCDIAQTRCGNRVPEAGFHRFFVELEREPCRDVGTQIVALLERRVAGADQHGPARAIVRLARHLEDRPGGQGCVRADQDGGSQAG